MVTIIRLLRHRHKWSRDSSVLGREGLVVCLFPPTPYGLPRTDHPFLIRPFSGNLTLLSGLIQFSQTPSPLVRVSLLNLGFPKTSVFKEEPDYQSKITTFLTPDLSSLLNDSLFVDYHQKTSIRLCRHKFKLKTNISISF